MRAKLQHARPGPAPLPPLEAFAGRRQRLLERIGDGVAVITAAPELFSSRDTEVPYRQSSDLYYLTGLLEPASVAVVTPHDQRRFTLFVRPRNPDEEAWSGQRVGVERAAAEYGADAVHPIEELAQRLPELLQRADLVHCSFSSSGGVDGRISAAFAEARRGRQKSGTGPRGFADLEVSTGELRLIKDEHEIERLRVAAEISAAGHLEAMQRARPGAGEWEVHAALESAFRSAGGSGPAFEPIVAAGANATILHYVSNQHRIRDGDLVLIDAGAAWGMYAGDISRTFPASGRFTPAQRDLYTLVLEAEEAAIAAVRPGVSIFDAHDAAVRTLTAGMIELGLLSGISVDEAIEKSAYRCFYFHNTSHWLGIDVHDVGPYRRGGEPVLLEPGMVFTVEPGIYITADDEGVREEFRGVGIRIEDNVLVTEGGCEILTRAVPVAPDAIEAVMAGD